MENIPKHYRLLCGDPPIWKSARVRAERSSKKCGGAGQSGRTQMSQRVGWWLEASSHALYDITYIGNEPRARRENPPTLSVTSPTNSGSYI